MQQDEIRSRMVKFYARGDRHVTINATQGHFATSQSHINYYIDVTRLKVRVAEAQELEKGDFRMTNKHETMYVVEPEENSIHQFMFRENIRPSIEGKNILLLVATMTTGETVKKSLECIEYYGGIIQGVAAIFSTTTDIEGTRVYPLFDQEDLPGYATYAPHDCPFCKQGTPLEAMVNAYGYSKL